MDVTDVMERDGELIDVLRRTLDAKANALDVELRSLHDHTEPARHVRPRTLLAAAAAAVVLAGAGGIVAITRDRGDTSTAPARSAPSVEEVVGALAGADDGAEQIQWFLPTVLPPGYEVTGIEATVAEWPAGEPGEPAQTVNSQQWELTEGGRTVGLVTAIAWSFVTGDLFPPPEFAQYVDDAALPERATIHGVEAAVSNHTASVRWHEGGSSYNVQGAGALTVDDVLAIAEASRVRDGTIDLGAALVAGGPLDGYELISSYDSADRTAEQQFVRITIEALDGIGGVVHLGVAPLDAYSAEPADETRVVDGVAYRIVERPPVGEIPAQVTVTAEIAGRHLVAAGPRPADELIALAAGVHPATLLQAAAGSRQIAMRAMTLPALGSATFADGVVASARSAPNGGVVLCLEEPIVTCRRDTELAELMADDEITPLRFEIFTVNGERHAIAWYGGTSEIDLVGDRQYEVVPASSGSGRFVSVPLRDADEPPTLQFAGEENLLAATPNEAIHP